MIAQEKQSACTFCVCSVLFRTPTLQLCFAVIRQHHFAINCQPRFAVVNQVMCIQLDDTNLFRFHWPLMAELQVNR